MKERRILIVEDDPDHADLILDIFDTEDVERDVVLMKDGQVVIDYLQDAYSPASPAKAELSSVSVARQTVSNGKEAIDLLKRLDYDLVLLPCGSYANIEDRGLYHT